MKYLSTFNESLNENITLFPEDKIEIIKYFINNIISDDFDLEEIEPFTTSDQIKGNSTKYSILVFPNSFNHNIGMLAFCKDYNPYMKLEFTTTVETDYLKLRKYIPNLEESIRGEDLGVKVESSVYKHLFLIEIYISYNIDDKKQSYAI